jgi:4a-hydroxytetrahydrobiopterin dehydratase
MLHLAPSRSRTKAKAMTHPTRIESAALDTWLKSHAGWEGVSREAITRLYKLADFASGLGFVVRIGCMAEKKDHHPDVELKWGSVRVTWSTHDAGGVTQLDLDAAQATDEIAG